MKENTWPIPSKPQKDLVVKYKLRQKNDGNINQKGKKQITEWMKESFLFAYSNTVIVM